MRIHNDNRDQRSRLHRMLAQAGYMVLRIRTRMKRQRRKRGA